MRFIGNKESLLDNLYQISLLTNLNKGVFCDFFSGTASVGRFFKSKGFEIVSSDLLYFSYVLQMAYIKNNKEPNFKKLLRKLKVNSPSLFSTPFEKIIFYLNSIKGVEGFIYKNYTTDKLKKADHGRKFFTPENGKKIDAIRKIIERWKIEKIITTHEYYILLACLVESVPFYANISGVYAAYLKKYDPRALKQFILKPIKIYVNNKTNFVYNKNSMDLLSQLKVDILYLDPPYNSRQYGANYHLLETIARYDNPIIKGVAGLRDYSKQKSEFCNKDSALKALDAIAMKAKYKYLMLSYNSEGIMSKTNILNVLNKYGKTKLIEIDYKRYRSNNNGNSKNKKIIKEQVYLLKRE